MTDTTIDMMQQFQELADKIEAKLKFEFVQYERVNGNHSIRFEVIFGRGKSSCHICKAKKRGGWGALVPTVMMHASYRNPSFQPRKNGTHNIKLIIEKLVENAQVNEADIEWLEKNEAKKWLRYGMCYAMSFLVHPGEEMRGSRLVWETKAYFTGVNGLTFHLVADQDGLFRFGFRGTNHGSPPIRWDRLLPLLRQIDAAGEPTKKKED